jgi:hypothetical protein
MNELIIKSCEGERHEFQKQRKDKTIDMCEDRDTKTKNFQTHKEQRK